VRYNSRLPATRQLGLLPMLALWAVLTLTAALYAVWLGYGGRAFAATLTAFAFLFLVMLLFAARGVDSRLAARFGDGSGHLLGVAVFLVCLIYLFGTNTFALTRAAAVAGLVCIPLALAAWAKQKPPGAWEDFLIIVSIWLAVKFLPSHWLWPYPGGRLAYVLTVLLCVNVALASFVLLRSVNGVGYSIGWSGHWSFSIVASFVFFGCIAIPLGQAMHFIEFSPQWSQWKSLPFLSLAILSRASHSELAGWWTASVLFGFTHITNRGFPNWRYVVLASIAGFFYGWTWRKTGSIFASALVHAAVDITWHFLFRTV